MVTKHNSPSHNTLPKKHNFVKYIISKQKQIRVENVPCRRSTSCSCLKHKLSQTYGSETINNTWRYKPKTLRRNCKCCFSKWAIDVLLRNCVVPNGWKPWFQCNCLKMVCLRMNRDPGQLSGCWANAVRIRYPIRTNPCGSRRPLWWIKWAVPFFYSH